VWNRRTTELSALRFAVLWRKIMQGTYNEKGDRWVERILSLRETCRLRGIPTFPVLVEEVICDAMRR
jgi:transposase